MKVIDLLNKIANGEEVPEKIRYGNVTYELNPITKRYIGEYMKNILIMETITIEELNDEVEIIENTPKEDKKIEHLKLHAPYPECTDDRFDDVEDKINEIIDYINGE